MNGRPRIYQLMVRHFGNTRTGGVAHGGIEENGCGKFADIDETAGTTYTENPLLGQDE